ncbi:hypothetical protein J6G99_03490 [bacterium]|nr:hypothetical protein [bacterium]
MIALVIIGVVSALTLPTLLTKINDTVTKNKIAVFERKLSKGTDLLNIEYGIGPYYNGANPSYEFAQALSKHLKIVTICDKDNLRNCVPYDSIHADEKDLKISDIKSGYDLGVNNNDYTDVAGIVLADGTPMILSWNKNCPVSDPDTVEKGQTTACISGIYDLNGAKGPNKFGKDVIGLNSSHIGWLNFAGLKITPPFTPIPITVDEYCTKQADKTWVLNENGEKYGIQYCALRYSTPIEKDYLAGAKKTCYELGGHLASIEDLNAIGNYIYNKTNFNSNKTQNNLVLDESKLGPLYGLGSSWCAIWQREASEGAYMGWAKCFKKNQMSSTYNTGWFGKGNSTPNAICVKNSN